MKRILFLFLLIPGACSDQEIVKPAQTPEVVSDNSNARTENLTCEFKTWYNSLAVNVNWHFGDLAEGHVYPFYPDNIWPVKPYNVTLTFKNLSTTTSCKIKVNGEFIWETLSPGEVYTPENPMFSMTCGCPEGCFLVDYYENVDNREHYNFKVSNMFGNQTPVDILVTYTLNASHVWQGSGQTITHVTHWIP